MPADAEWAARLAEVSAVYSGSFAATLRWGYTSEVEPESPSAFWEAPPSGYQPVSNLSGEVVLGAAQFYEGHSADPNQPDLECFDSIRVPATIELATGDGALAGTAQGSLYLGAGPSKLEARLDLADALGTLDLHLDPDLGYRASAGVRLDFYPEGKRGQLEIAVEPELQSEDRAVGYWPLRSSFPDDGCGFTGFPSTTDVPLAWLAGQTAAQALESWNAELHDLSIAGVRHDCAPNTREDGPVELSFEIGAAQSELCYVPAWAAARVPGSFHFTGRTRLKTSDERIDFAFVSGEVTPDSLALASDASSSPWSGADAVLIPAQQFEAQSGIQGVHPGDSTALGYHAVAYFHRTPDLMQVNGELLVQSTTCTSQTSCTNWVHSDVRWSSMDDSESIPSCRL